MYVYVFNEQQYLNGHLARSPLSSTRSRVGPSFVRWPDTALHNDRRYQELGQGSHRVLFPCYIHTYILKYYIYLFRYIRIYIHTNIDTYIVHLNTYIQYIHTYTCTQISTIRFYSILTYCASSLSKWGNSLKQAKSASFTNSCISFRIANNSRFPNLKKLLDTLHTTAPGSMSSASGENLLFLEVRETSDFSYGLRSELLRYHGLRTKDPVPISYGIYIVCIHSMYVCIEYASVYVWYCIYTDTMEMTSLHLEFSLYSLIKPAYLSNTSSIWHYSFHNITAVFITDTTY